MARRYLRTGYTKDESKPRLVHLPPEVDAAFVRLAGENGTTVSALLNVAAVMYAERVSLVETPEPEDLGTIRNWAGQSFGTVTSAGVVSNPVLDSLDSYGSRLANVRDAYSDAVDRLAGHPIEENT